MFGDRKELLKLENAAVMKGFEITSNWKALAFIEL